MIITDKLYEFAVKVNDGSGCLFQPKTNDYTYVLTAKHVIEHKKDINITAYLNGKSQSLVVQGTPFTLKNSDEDVAIIKVNYVEGLDSIYRFNRNNGDLKCFLLGHPEVRGDQLVHPEIEVEHIENFSSYRPDPISHILGSPDGHLEGIIVPVPIKREIDGMSGGGIIGIKDNEKFLIGIQKGMKVESAKEPLGRVDIIPLSFFDEIIRENSEQLKELTVFKEEPSTKEGIEQPQVIKGFYQPNWQVEGDIIQSTGDITLNYNSNTKKEDK